MTTRIFLLTLMLAAACFGARGAQAVEALSTVELKSHCDEYPQDAEGADGIFCVRYIQGFIDGAVITDERVTNNVAAEYERDALTQRAIRTRLGNRLNRYGPSYYAEFCLGDPVPLKEVVDRVVAHLGSTPEDKLVPLARAVVYDVLREHYACPDDDTR